MNASAGAPYTFPGGTALTAIDVYSWESADGCAGGSPHLHTASTEAYLVTHGSGAVETLTLDGVAQHDLTPGDLLWFTPGTIHRLLNAGGLRLTVVMQNAGLPESGDAILTFPPAHLASPADYARAATLASGVPETTRAAAARARRDLALEGYATLKHAALEGDFAPLRAFHRQAVALVAPRLAAWDDIVQQRVVAPAERTRAWLASMARGDATHFAEARVSRAPRAERAYGMCGYLETWTDGRH
ncbi:cupin domain-containing protein [Micrococcales bacterium 31B]|nr:cupin domain-containing protein [Micrococcales bacterium 31B]